MNESGWKLSLLIDAISCVTNIYYSSFDERFNPLFSTAPNFGILSSLFALGTKRKYTPDNIPETDKPAFLTNSLGIAWIAEIESKEGIPYRIHVIGPVFLDDFQTEKLNRKLDDLGASLTLKYEFLAVIKELPIVNITRFFEYGIMFHFCLTGERIGISDFGKEPEERADESVSDVDADTHGSYLALTRMLKCVEEGNLNYKPEMNRLAVSGKLGEISNRDSLRKIKNAVIIFTAHCANSAIRGGLSSDVAYSLSDRYIQSIEASETIEQIAILNETMVTDYVRRVHNLKNAMGNMSPQIHDCCDLISMNPEKTYDIHMFAVKYGYSDYYFSTKFKKETGQTFRDFLMEKKVERACELLTRGTMDIQEISDSLGFATHSLFGQEFKKRMGCTPSTYRQERGIGNEKD